ncbi:MAG TPA: hypothetical protein VFD22_08540 [Gemmatimonadaceae bacterium]|nr:hypothetical protein [Gemmatimonadaceae bacterium]
MRVDILGNNKASFVKPMADGLSRMLKSCGAEARVHYDGVERLMRRPLIDTSSLRSIAGSSIRLRSTWRNLSEFIDRLDGTDLIVVVAHVPSSFSPMVLPNVELLRRIFPDVPIVNYDLVYLPSLDSWSRTILRDEPTQLAPESLKMFSRGKFGLERYDWYLLASVGGYIPLEQREHPYSLIGIDIDDGFLYPDQQDFTVLVDFPQTRGEYPKYREIQLKALDLAGIKYRTLEGRYTREELLAVFRTSSALLLAHAESFGLPVCEAQACGCLIFTPSPHWVTAHWLGKEYTAQRSPALSSNFVVYNNEPQSLADELLRARDNFDPQKVRTTFEAQQPELFRGDRAALQNFLSAVESGKVHSQLHRSHADIGRKSA